MGIHMEFIRVKELVEDDALCREPLMRVVLVVFVVVFIYAY